MLLKNDKWTLAIILPGTENVLGNYITHWTFPQPTPPPLNIHLIIYKKNCGVPEGREESKTYLFIHSETFLTSFPSPSLPIFNASPHLTKSPSLAIVWEQLDWDIKTSKYSVKLNKLKNRLINQLTTISETFSFTQSRVGFITTLPDVL